MRAKEEQHCGVPVDHPPHGHVARPRQVVEKCVCNDSPCVCPSPDMFRPTPRKREFHCTGKMVTSVSEPIPTRVNL